MPDNENGFYADWMDQMFHTFHRMKHSAMFSHQDLPGSELRVLTHILHASYPDTRRRPCPAPPPHPGDVSGEGAEVMISALQKQLHLSKSALSQTMNSLENKDYITRAIDTGDRRRIAVRITAPGCRAVYLAHERLRWYFRRLMNGLGEDDAAELLRLLRRVTEVAETIDITEYDRLKTHRE